MRGAEMKQPCDRDCPNRSATCHGTCEAYLAFERERNASYANGVPIYSEEITAARIKRMKASRHYKNKYRGGLGYD